MADERVRRSLDAAVAVESLDAVQDALASWWADVGAIDPRVRMSFELAVVEIAGNIVEHSVGMHEEIGRRFTLDLEADADALRAVFEDNGLPAGVDLSSVTMADVLDEDGRGLALAVASVDRIEHVYEDGRNIWRLECGRAG